ncbi:MAG: phosphotransferase [Alphaproteobacteria bacterium]|nr:phosphotransferase [Alphaproteobacteria bacterium]
MISDSTRLGEVEQFRADTGWSKASLSWLGQDASTRRYARLRHGNQKAILMDAPLVEADPCTPDMTPAERELSGWNAMTRLAASRVEAFVLIANHLRSIGLRTPDIFAYDTRHGFALIEDFGDGREFARLLERGLADENVLYTKAAETLAHLHAQPVPKILCEGEISWPVLPFDDVALRANADLFADWLPQLDKRMRLSSQDRARWDQVLDGLIAQAEAFPREFTLRDYHAENLLWLPNGQIALLDFQDAVLGWDAWDMAMLTQDARRKVSDQATRGAIHAYLNATGKGEADFHERLAVIGTLNALRITGVFARLQVRDGKPRYGQFMPRQQGLLAQNLAHPAAAEMAAFVREKAPFILEARP